jgi:hypothetical protein
MGLFVVLLVFGIVPGLIYLLIGGSSQPYYQCTQCRGRLVLIPVDSPVAQAALSKKPQGPELSAAGKTSSKFCTACGNSVSADGRFCSQCGQPA